MQYFCYVLLDFVACDRELEEPALAAALLLCKKLGWEKHFQPIACKELKLRKNQFEKLNAEAESILAKARQARAEARRRSLTFSRNVSKPGSPPRMFWPACCR